jgi:hypothetical protein
MYLYETHVHTAPISACAKADVRSTLEFYRSIGYAGVFMTDHFIDGNIARELRELSYEARIEGYFSAYEEGKRIGEEIGLDVFSGIEMSYKGTDFLVYGIDKAWCLCHKDIDRLPKSELLKLIMEEGALVVQAHPFREASYIDHIRLFPRCVHGVEIFNASRNDFENALAAQYCNNYSLIAFAGSDNHNGGARTVFGGMATEERVKDTRHFIELVLQGRATPFCKDEAGFHLLHTDREADESNADPNKS